MIAGGFRKILPYVLVVFFGYVGFSLPLPLLPEMFLDSQRSIFSSVYSIEMRRILLGVVIAAYPFGQLIGAPILGRWSDRFGRKRVILCSLVGSMVGYIITALAVQASHLPSIFLGLFFCGLSEGNVAIAQSVVADLSREEEGSKISNFGWINLFTCFGFIVGPLLGGSLSSSDSIPWFTFATPFWMAAGLTLIGIAIVLLFSQETRNPESRRLHAQYWGSLKEGLTHKGLRKLYIVNFFLALGYFSYFRFFPVYIEAKFSFNSSQLGYAIAYGSVTFAIFCALILKPIARRMRPKNAVSFFSILLALAFLLLLFPDFWQSLIVTVPLVGLSLCVVMTYAAVIVSDEAPFHFQGQALGMLTSVQVLAEIFTGLGGGFLANQGISYPMIIGACALVLGGGILWFFNRT